MSTIGDSKLALVLRALDNSMRRELMKLAAEKPMNGDEFYDAIVNKGFNIRYRESVYKELQTLVVAGLLDKYEGGDRILYKSKVSKIIIDANTLEVDVVNRAAVS